MPNQYLIDNYMSSEIGVREDVLKSLSPAEGPIMEARIQGYLVNLVGTDEVLKHVSVHVAGSPNSSCHIKVTIRAKDKLGVFLLSHIDYNPDIVASCVDASLPEKA